MIPLLLALFYWQRISNSFKSIGLLVVMSVVCDLLTLFFFELSLSTRIYELFLNFGNLYILFVLPAIFFVWLNSSIHNKIILKLSLGIIYLGLAIVFISFIGNDNLFSIPNGFGILINYLAIIILCLLYLVDLTFYSKIVYLYKEPFFYIVIGLLIGSCSAFPYWAMNQFLEEASKRALYSIQQASNIFMMLIFGLAIYLEAFLSKR